MDFNQTFDGYLGIIVALVLGVVINVVSNIVIYKWKQTKISKENLEAVISIIYDDLDKFIYISEIIVDSYKKSRTFWYEYSTHISDSRNSLKLDKLFLLNRDLRKRFLSYYTNTYNLLLSLRSQQEQMYTIRTSINESAELSEEDKAKKMEDTYKNTILSDLINDLRLKKIEAEAFKKDIQDEFKFLNK